MKKLAAMTVLVLSGSLLTGCETMSEAMSQIKSAAGGTDLGSAFMGGFNTGIALGQGATSSGAMANTSNVLMQVSQAGSKSSGYSRSSGSSYGGQASSSDDKCYRVMAHNPLAGGGLYQTTIKGRQNAENEVTSSRWTYGGERSAIRIIGEVPCSN